jgi:cytochrome P450
MDDPEHARLRRMVTSVFAIKRVEALRPLVQRIVDGLIDAMLAGPTPVDLVGAFALPVPSLVICHLLGVPYADHDFFQANTRNLMKNSTAPEEAAASQRKMIDYLDNLVAQKLTSPGDDLLSTVAYQVKEGQLSQRDQCLGQPLARMELQVVYGTLYRRIPTLRLATDLDEIPFKHDGLVYGVYELPVTW